MVGGIVAITGVAITPGEAPMPHDGLEGTEGVQGGADRGFGHVQMLGNAADGRESTTTATSAAVEVQEISESGRGQIVGQNVPADEGIAPVPAEPQVAVGSVYQMILLFAVMVATALEKVALGHQLGHGPLSGGGAAPGQSGQGGEGNGHSPVLPASQEQQDNGHPLGGVLDSLVADQRIGHSRYRA